MYIWNRFHSSQVAELYLHGTVVGVPDCRGDGTADGRPKRLRVMAMMYIVSAVAARLPGISLR
jgi:hypothetical protein